MEEKMVFTDELCGIKEYEEKWIECKQDLSRKIIEKMILENKIFETDITILLNFIVQGVWVYRLEGYLSSFQSNPTVKSNEVTIYVTKNDKIDYLKESINKVKSQITVLQENVLNDNYIFDENESIVWNRNKVNSNNSVLYSDINLLNQMYYLLNKELLNLFISKVKEQYELFSVSDNSISEMLCECIPFFNIKNADKLNWDTIERKMNSIIKVFNNKIK